MARTTHLQNPRWRANLATLADNDLSFDLQIFPRQMIDAVRLVQQNPRMQFILDHTGCPVRDGEGWHERWKEGMRQLAGMPNLVVKLLGFGMFDRNWTTASISLLVEEAIDLVGVDRCMFASNYPVDSLMASYRAIWGAYVAFTSRLSPSDRDKLLYSNAESIYRI